MRIWVFGAIAITVGASIGAIATRMQFAKIEESFELAATTAKSDVGETPASEMTLVTGDTKDFGMVLYESEHAHTFVIRNDGTAPLRVRKDNVSCGLCVLTDFTSDVVPPGETLEIDVTLRARKRGPKLDETLELVTSDPAHHTATLHLVAYIGRAVQLTAEGLPLGTIDSTTGDQASCQVHGHFSDKIEFVASEFTLAPNREYFEVEVKQLDIAELAERNPYVRTAYDVTVRVKPGMPTGQFQQILKMVARVEGHEDTTLELPVEGRVAGAISVLGPQYATEHGFLSGGRVSSDKGKTWQLKVMVKGPQHADVKLTIDSIDPEKHLTATLGEPMSLGDNITMHPLTVSVPKGAPPIVRLGNEQGDAGQIVIKTTHPLSKEVLLLVRFAVE